LANMPTFVLGLVNTDSTHIKYNVGEVPTGVNYIKTIYNL